MCRKLIVVLLVMFCLTVSTVLGQSREKDSLALVDLYNNTDGDNWKYNTNWLNGPIDIWWNVTVSGDRVTRLILCNNDLTGSIPSSIENLTSLEQLHLGDNQLSGSIPSSIGNLTSLEKLYLFYNNLTGSIPSEIGGLTSLQSLSLQGNQLSGSIPSSIGNLSKLGSLYLYSNDFTAIPSTIGNIWSLHFLDIRNNDLVDFPSLSGLTALYELRIQNNKFTFEDIEPNIGVPSDQFQYSPQDSVGNAQNRTVTVGSNLTISVSVGGEHNEYQWKKDGSVISGATNDSYTITSAEMSDAGSYTCEITNTVATALTLYSRPINVTVNPAPPKITVTSPNGGEYWVIDSIYNITWTSNGTSGDVKIEYSTDNGSSWIEEIASTTDDGSYSWTIPDTPSDSCRIRVRDTDGSPSDVSNSMFTISPAPSITVTSPNGGEDWKVDSTYNITWTSSNASGDVKIEYSMDNGSVWAELIASIPDTGIYSWTIPDIPSDSCMVRISDTEGDPTDVSDSVFSISPSSSIPEDKLPEIYSMSVKTLAVSNKFQVRYSIPEKTSITLGVYNINGTKIKEFREEKSPGVYTKEIYIKNIPAGIYFVKIEANGGKFAKSDKFLLLK